jgi:hypothetical protein
VINELEEKENSNNDIYLCQDIVWVSSLSRLLPKNDKVLISKIYTVTTDRHCLKEYVKKLLEDKYDSRIIDYTIKLRTRSRRTKHARY